MHRVIEVVPAATADIPKVTMSRMTRPTRPAFLTLAQIHMPVHAWTFIGHRVNGIVLTASVPIGIYLLNHSLQDEQGFVQVTGLLGHEAAKLDRTRSHR